MRSSHFDTLFTVCIGPRLIALGTARALKSGMGIGRLWALGLIISLVFGTAIPDASARSKRKKKIVQIKLEAPKKKVATQKKRKKRSQPVVVQHRRNDDAEIEPLSKNQKTSNLGIRKEWAKNKKSKKRRSVASKKVKKNKKSSEKLEDESKMKDQDLNKMLQNMQNFSEAELLTEYEGSF